MVANVELTGAILPVQSLRFIPSSRLSQFIQTAIPPRQDLGFPSSSSMGSVALTRFRHSVLSSVSNQPFDQKVVDAFTRAIDLFSPFLPFVPSLSTCILPPRKLL